MKKLLCIDGNSILNRAYYGIRMLTNRDGFPTNALFGMVNILSKQIEALEPDYAAIAEHAKTATVVHIQRSRGYTQRNAFDLDTIQKLHGMECYECGSCTYVCPAKRRLTQKFKQARRAVMDAGKKKA